MASSRKRGLNPTFRPRIRAWSDRTGDYHVGGEPDGFRTVLEAIRRVGRRWRDRQSLGLIGDPIPKGRNPVPELGVRTRFGRLEIHWTVADSRETRVTTSDGTLRLAVSRASVSQLGWAVAEAMDGEGDFCIRLAGSRARESWLWFWGYSNEHGRNGF